MRRATCHSQCDITGLHAGLFVEGFALNQEDLTDMGKIEVIIERGTAPNPPRLDAPVIGRGSLGEVGNGIALLEQQSDITLQSGLVSLGDEVIMRLLADNESCQRALGQQGIARDVFACDVAAFEQRDGHADFIGALLFLTALDGQCAYFFWV